MRRLRSDDAEPQNLAEGDWSARRCASTVIGTIVFLIGASIIVIAAAMPGLIEAVVLVKRADNGLEWPLSAGARHSWAEIEARGRTIRDDFAAEYGVSLPLVAIDLGRWDKGDGPFEAVAR